MADKIHKILIVDNEIDEQQALKKTLESTEKFKSEIIFAENGITALMKLNQQKFDLILSDFRMPKMDGITLLKKAKDRYPDLVRILISGNMDMFLILKAIYKAKVDEYIEKPWRKNELNDIIFELLKKKWDRENKLLEGLRSKYGQNLENVPEYIYERSLKGILEMEKKNPHDHDDD